VDSFDSDIGGGSGGRAWPAAQAGVADSEASGDSEATEAAAAVQHWSGPNNFCRAMRRGGRAALRGRARTVSAEPQRVSTGSCAMLRRGDSPTHPGAVVPAGYISLDGN
jgi:hypothetical protein